MSSYLEACKTRGFSSRISTKAKKVPFALQAHKWEHWGVIDCFLFILTWSSTAGYMKEWGDSKNNIPDPGVWDGITFPIVMTFEH